MENTVLIVELDSELIGKISKISVNVYCKYTNSFQELYDELNQELYDNLHSELGELDNEVDAELN